VLRGGAFSFNPQYVRCAVRFDGFRARFAYNLVGFRVVLWSLPSL
jgi:formylglycine-generating enzyme required for sulfatase activity